MSEQNFNEFSDIIPNNTENTEETVNITIENIENIEKNDTAEDTPNEESASQPRGKRLLSFIEYLEIFAIGVCAVLVLFSFVFRICTVDGDSMKNTLHNGEKLVISDLFYTPERGDVIVFHQTGNRNLPLVKRVIGIEGDTVVIDFDSWTVTITDKGGNTSVIDEPYINIDTPLHRQSGVHTYVVPEGCVFVLGDNRNDSMDSTDMTSVGYVDVRRILGKVIFRYSPADKFGSIE